MLKVRVSAVLLATDSEEAAALFTRSLPASVTLHLQQFDRSRFTHRGIAAIGTQAGAATTQQTITDVHQTTTDVHRYYLRIHSQAGWIDRRPEMRESTTMTTALEDLRMLARGHVFIGGPCASGFSLLVLNLMTAHRGVSAIPTMSLDWCPEIPVGSTFPKKLPTCRREGIRGVGTIYDRRGWDGLRRSKISSVIRIDWRCRNYRGCSDLPQLWEHIAQNHPGRVWSLSCLFVPSVCAELSGTAHLLASQPGVQMVPFNAPPTDHAVVQWVEDVMAATPSTDQPIEVSSTPHEQRAPTVSPATGVQILDSDSYSRFVPSTSKVSRSLGSQ